MWMRFSIVLIQLVAVGSAAPMLAAAAVAADSCSGHQLLPVPRSASSCLTVSPQVYASPDAALSALIFPADPDSHDTPDMESRVVIQTRDGKLLVAKDYSSPGGANGYYVVGAKWSPDSQFFVYSMSSAG